MSKLLLGLLFLCTSAHADMKQKLKEWCFTYLVQEDPYPFAEYLSADLIELYRRTYDQGVKRELDFRLDAYMLTQNEAISFLHVRKFDKVEL